VRHAVAAKCLLARGYGPAQLAVDVESVKFSGSKVTGSYVGLESGHKRRRKLQDWGQLDDKRGRVRFTQTEIRNHREGFVNRKVIASAGSVA